MEIAEIKDILFPSDNIFDIPTLDIEQQATELELPFKPYGAERRSKTDGKTVHFYVDDYRFEGLWKHPENLLKMNPSAVVEPNFSLFDTTPVSYGLMAIYKKRWLARWWQSCGVKVFADLNVSGKFAKYNLLGIPDGYNAFSTRGYADRLETLEAEIAIAQRISGKDCPNMVVYGGGERAHEIAARHNLIYVHGWKLSKTDGNGEK